MAQSSDRLSAQVEFCSQSPKTAQPWTELARQLLEDGRAAEAVAAAEHALALEPAQAETRALRQAAVEQLEAGEPALSVLELTAALNAEDPDAHLALGQAYAERDRPADAERCFKRALTLKPDMAAAHAGLGAAYLSVGIDAGAEHHARLALGLEPGHAIASQALSTVLEKRGDLAGARSLLDQAYARQCLFLEPAAQSRLTVLVLATQSHGNVPYRHIMPPEQYTRLIWYMEHADPNQAAHMPPLDLVFNAIGDPDLAAPTEASVRRFLAKANRPVLNDPAKVARTHRDQAPALLGDLEDVVVPATARLPAAAIARHGLAGAVTVAGLAAPVLVRPIGSHGGKGLERAQTEADLQALAQDFDGQDVYVTQYWDYRAPDGRFRKGRMIFVDRQPYPYHWAVSDHWLVHYESAGMGGQANRQAEEQRFLEQPQAVVGARAMAAIARIGARLDLDYCGVDFSILPDGRLLVFEANATMFVHPETPDSELAYKNPAVRRIVEAFQQRLAQLAAAPGTSQTA